MPDNLYRRDPSPLPATPEALLAQRKLKSALYSINDEVEKILFASGDEEKLYGPKGISYLYAIYDEQAVEGSLSADNTLAAEVIRKRAAISGSPVAGEKLATISKALGVVLRRYGEDRKTRKNTVSGERVPNGDDHE